ncbi:MAG: DUF2314 domain-containing protein [Winogradskyella sp.]|uniref:DUF2314 domain-containing protein n=1 Tax=Winogradskyella sp. TaxID=1883156 RepID=UPI000F3D41FD|nr:DUF2314 domain-containing protein [Winogradskyella sp.]RNC86836.1 MAG: DUF2314 domain-containing protein [Winogradskyella sp.]
MKLHQYLSILTLCLTFTVSSQTEFNSGKLSDDKILVQYGIYMLGEEKVSSDDIKSIVSKNYPDITLIESFPERVDVKGINVLVTEIQNVEEEFTAPDLEFLKYKNLGLTNAEMNAMQKSSQVFVLQFVFEQELLLKAYNNANNYISDLTKNHDIIIYDLETRNSISEEYWNKNLLIKGNAITVANHITIHFYQKEDFCRAITLGMLKFGLPDITIEDLSCQSSEDLMTFINVTAQTLFEKDEIENKGKLTLDVNAIQNESYKSMVINSMYDNAVGKAEVDIINGRWEEGDPENILMEIAFPLQDTQVAQMETIKLLFGSLDEVTMIKHDDLLLKASEDARAKVPELYDKFQNGLGINSHLLIKFPFDEDDQREWMWVEVVKWEGDLIIGLLQNEPRFISDLKAGQQVEKNIDDMFDYILYNDDGSMEGNETGKIIEKMRN